MSDAETTPLTHEAASKVEEARELIQRLCVADNNVGVFSIEHPLTKQSIQDAHAWLTAMIERRGDAVTLSMANDQFLFEEMPLELRNPQVARLFAKFMKLHVNNVQFRPGMPAEAFGGFIEILGMRSEDIEGYGGVAAILEAAGIDSIVLSAASYVMIEEDQRVVSREAKVYDERLTKATADSVILRDLLREVMERTEGRDWMLNKIKNSPKQMTHLFAESIEKALVDSENPDADETIQSLVDNIKMVGGRLMDEHTGEIRDGEEDLKDAVLKLETEIRNRSQKLMTTEASRRFVHELLDMVTSYADQVKAQRITEQFVQDETSLKKTEKLLRSLSGKSESADEMLKRLRDVMVKRGMSVEDLERLTEVAATAAKPKRRRKSFDRALRDGIVQRVKGFGLDSEKHGAAVDQLMTFVANKLQEKDKVHRAETKALTEKVQRRNTFIDEISDCGVVIWNPQGEIEHINRLARDATGLAAGDRIPPETIGDIQQRSEPGGSGATPDTGTPEGKLVACLVAVVMDKERGVPMGAMLAVT